MNVASLEPSKELYELSGWEDTEYAYLALGNEVPDTALNIELAGEHGWMSTPKVPAYDLGYLLRKLPAVIEGRFLVLSHPDAANDYTGWVAGYTTNIDDIVKGKVNFTHTTVADTPEDAAAMLAIQLFKEGVLK